MRAAECINPPAVRSILPYAYKRTELLLAGHSKQEVIAAIKAAIDKKELPALEQGTVSYMMSRDSYSRWRRFSSVRRATVARSGPACARLLRNQSQGFGIRNALCAGESCNTELTTKAGETKVKKDRFRLQAS